MYFKQSQTLVSTQHASIFLVYKYIYIYIYIYMYIYIIYNYHGHTPLSMKS